MFTCLLKVATRLKDKIMIDELATYVVCNGNEVYTVVVREYGIAGLLRELLELTREEC